MHNCYCLRRQYYIRKPLHALDMPNTDTQIYEGALFGPAQSKCVTPLDKKV